MADNIILFCLIHGDDPADRGFPIGVQKTISVGALKELIKTKLTPRLDNIVVNEITLWKVSISTEELSQLNIYFDIKTKGTKLSPLDDIQDAFPSIPSGKNVHIIVELPPVIKCIEIAA